MDKPEKIKLGKCIICHKEQAWNPSGYVETKGWHEIHLNTGSGDSASNFGNRITLRYPTNSSDVICSECIPAAVERYMKAMEVWK